MPGDANAIIQRAMNRLHSQAEQEQRGKEFIWLTRQWDDFTWREGTVNLDKRLKVEQKIKNWSRANRTFAHLALRTFREAIEGESDFSPTSLRAYAIMRLVQDGLDGK